MRLMRGAVLTFLSSPLLICSAANAEAAGCEPLGLSKTQLAALKDAGWKFESDETRNAFVIALTACLGSPDPFLRDDIAFEALYYHLRERLLTDANMVKLAGILQKQMIAPDPDGFQRPFAALALSEVARADRVKPYLSPDERNAMLSAAIGYMNSIDDYRGFDPQSGYRHGVAHASDLMLQLGLNPAFGKNELLAIRDAVASQIAPKGQFFITGESERLARPILFIAQRNLITEAEWSAWFAEIAGPGEPGKWDNWFRSPYGIARKHNLMAFLSAIYVNVALSENDGFAVLRPGVTAALNSLP